MSARYHEQRAAACASWVCGVCIVHIPELSDSLRLNLTFTFLLRTLTQRLGGPGHVWCVTRRGPVSKMPMHVIV